LCAEDSIFFKRLVVQYLERSEWEVTVVGHGLEAWNLLNEQPHAFDLLISDINMPHMNGFELAEKVRSDRRFDKLPMVALTTQVDDESRERGLELGFQRYVGKINKFALRRCIEEILSAEDFTFRKLK
jgi:two-component system chemotaxis sensor kinase CheA